MRGFSDLAIHEGDKIKMTVNAHGKTGGTAIVENVTTGKRGSFTFSNQNHELCQTNAEWIVEDFKAGGGLVPFADFSTVTFTDATATNSKGDYGVDNGTII